MVVDPVLPELFDVWPVVEPELEPVVATEPVGESSGGDDD